MAQGLEISYIPCLSAVASLGDVVDAFAVSPEEEDFAFGICFGCSVQGVDVTGEFLPLRVYL